MVLQDKIDKLIEIGRCYGMEINEEKTKVMRISRHSSLVKLMIEQKLLENVKSFKYLGRMLTNDGRCICEIKSMVAMANAAFNKKRAVFTSKMDLELRSKLLQRHSWSIHLYASETWTLRVVDQKYLKVLKYGAREGWIRSVGPIMWEMKKYCSE
jgi:uncharacterized protein YaaW (UPF0174 family)